ncbi:cell death abnormality protein 1, partial [Biomphalaria pfeifferi]
DCCLYRLKYFKMTSFDINSKIVWTYQDPSSDPLDIYTFSIIENIAVSKIRISLTNKEAYDIQFIISLCE